MVKHAQQAIILLKEDVALIRNSVKNEAIQQPTDRHNLEKLNEEIQRARVLEKQEIPPDVVRLNSAVRIRDEATQGILDIQLVLPGQADIKKGRLSVLAPLGTALIGFREGQRVSWEMPAGVKQFTILKVNQPASPATGKNH